METDETTFKRVFFLYIHLRVLRDFENGRKTRYPFRYIINDNSYSSIRFSSATPGIINMIGSSLKTISKRNVTIRVYIYNK